MRENHPGGEAETRVFSNYVHPKRPIPIFKVSQGGMGEAFSKAAPAYFHPPATPSAAGIRGTVAFEKATQNFANGTSVCPRTGIIEILEDFRAQPFLGREKIIREKEAARYCPPVAPVPLQNILSKVWKDTLPRIILSFRAQRFLKFLPRFFQKAGAALPKLFFEKLLTKAILRDMMYSVTGGMAWMFS